MKNVTLWADRTVTIFLLLSSTTVSSSSVRSSACIHLSIILGLFHQWNLSTWSSKLTTLTPRGAAVSLLPLKIPLPASSPSLPPLPPTAPLASPLASLPSSRWGGGAALSPSSTPYTPLALFWPSNTLPFLATTCLNEREINVKTKKGMCKSKREKVNWGGEKVQIKRES